MHVFTSITNNYLPKARVLATTLKQNHPEAKFHVVLSDHYPSDLDAAQEPFDSIMFVEDLPIHQVRSWVFMHSVVELCTAVKACAAREIMRRYRPATLFYLDPDIAVLGSMKPLIQLLEVHDILLTPHLTTPEEELVAVQDNEMCALRHGVYNLGFIGIKDSAEGHRLLDWWANRLYNFCYDEIPRGIFTDQRWIDLVPAFFPGTHIVRDPQYNVATWNLSHRRVSGEAPYHLQVNGQGMSFYHFSGFDSGAQQMALRRYGKASPVLLQLRNWYIQQCETMGQVRDGKRACHYNFFEDGTPILGIQRRYYRDREDLQNEFPDPFSCGNGRSSFLNWFRANVNLQESGKETECFQLQRQLMQIQSSRSWRLAQRLRRAYQLVVDPLKRFSPKPNK